MDDLEDIDHQRCSHLGRRERDVCLIVYFLTVFWKWCVVNVYFPIIYHVSMIFHISRSYICMFVLLRTPHFATWEGMARLIRPGCTTSPRSSLSLRSWANWRLKLSQGFSLSLSACARCREMATRRSSQHGIAEQLNLRIMESLKDAANWAFSC